MRILVVSTVPYRKNGIATVIENLVSSQAFAGADLSFLFPIDNDPIMLQRLQNRGFRIYTASRRAKDLFSYFCMLQRLIRREKFDLIHVHGNSSTLAVEMLAARMAGCKVRIAHSHNTTCLSLTLHRILNPLFQSCCTHRLACGEKAGEWMFGDREFVVVNNGIHTARFAFREEERRRLRDQFGLKEDRILIGHVGLFTKVKNQSFLIEILNALVQTGGDYGLLLLGEGELRPVIEERVNAMGLADRVIFAGVTDQVGAYLSACDLIVMPSLYEGLPLSLIEEQANGLHCVVSDTITEEVDKTGNLTFLPLSSGADHWAKVIRELDLRCDRMAASASAIEQIKACGYDIQTEAQRLKEYYQRAVTAKGE